MSVGDRPVELVYIASPGHSGSTLLDLMLSSHSGLFSVGEIKQLSPSWQRRCTCGAPSVWACPFWQAIDDRLGREHGTRLADLDVMCDDDARFARDNEAIFRAVLSETGAHALIDSSKNLKRLKRLGASGRFRITPLRLRRSACGVVYSNVKKGRPWFEAARQVKANALAAEKYFATHDHISIWYERLASDPSGELRGVMDAIGLAYEPGQIEDFKSGERHNVGGNRMRFDGDTRVRLDERWRRELTPWQKAMTRLVQTDTVYGLLKRVRRRGSAEAGG